VARAYVKLLSRSFAPKFRKIRYPVVLPFSLNLSSCLASVVLTQPKICRKQERHGRSCVIVTAAER
jgi:hypothetical protein